MGWTTNLNWCRISSVNSNGWISFVGGYSTELVGWPTTLLRLWLLWLFLLLLMSHFVRNRNATVRIVRAQFSRNSISQSLVQGPKMILQPAEFHIIWVIPLPSNSHHQDITCLVGASEVSINLNLPLGRGTTQFIIGIPPAHTKSNSLFRG